MAIVGLGVLIVSTGVLLAVDDRDDRDDDDLSAGCQAERCAALTAITQACPCESAIGHGRYVRCVGHAAKNAGVFHACRRQIIDCARRSTCGLAGAARCIVASRRQENDGDQDDAGGSPGGAFTCKLARSEARCLSRGGVVEAGTDCCPDCGLVTTTTTLASTTTTRPPTTSTTTAAVTTSTTTAPVTTSTTTAPVTTSTTAASTPTTTATTTTSGAVTTSTTTATSSTTTTTGAGCNLATDCPLGQACNTVTHACSTDCAAPGTTGCNGGCCNLVTISMGSCVAGTADAQCGNDGGICDDCVDSCDPGPKCIAGACGCSSDTDCVNDAANCDPFLSCVGGECS